MNKENKRNAAVLGAGGGGGTSRVTRARARALTGGNLQATKPCFKPDQKRTLRVNAKRAASDENAAVPAAAVAKRRAVLGDVSNVYCAGSNAGCFPKAGKVQSKQIRKCPTRKTVELAAGSSSNQIRVEDADDAKTKLAEELSKIRVEEAQDTTKETQETANLSAGAGGADDPMLITATSPEPDQGKIHLTKEGNRHLEKLVASPGKDVIDVDSGTKDPQLCSMYVSDIQKNLRVQELDQRPSTTYMAELQHDINPSMRAILIDWLVEVSEEYKLVPHTLYLTVNLIDRFLSGNYIGKQRLQLLGVTCMLISSKYEEICAPRVEEFCFITDNTYTRDEVVKMESQVINFLYFQLAVPTTKTFLRRFIYAAQASYKAPSRELEFLANYLAELTLLDYDFLKFLPSLIAASAVFLARWTLTQSANPWNPTLEHYTRYKASDLKTAVLALEELQLNTNNCPLNAIRDKYKQQKYKSVATLTSSQRVLSLFQGQSISGSI